MRHHHRQTQHTTDCSREPSEPGQDLRFKGGSRAGAALVIPTNPSTSGGATAAPPGNKGRAGEPAAPRRADPGQESPDTPFTLPLQPDVLPKADCVRRAEGRGNL